ncbi:MAG: nuclear transport factor 2 family protein, partial [Rhodococcus sp. (in: high G+C Gram-positive bacteria)]|uniref:nuclear transport factor 2 family protein n=1 Tax=Rhodococcus sp. TaxID=1831 RepID=UPI003BAF506C
MTTTATETETALAYIQAVSDHDLTGLDALFDDRLVAAFAGTEYGKREWIGALTRLLPALVHNEIRETYTEADRVCVVYDFVTDTDAGAVRCVELLTVTDNRITSIELLLDR